MRRILLSILIIGVLLSGCSDNPVTGNVADALNDSLDNVDNATDINETKIELSDDKKDEDSGSEVSTLQALKDQQKELFSERVKVLQRKREILDNLNHPNNTFEDRQFYQKAFDIVKQKESELTFGITKLESKIRTLEEMEAQGESLEAYKNDLERFNKNEAEYEKQLRELGSNILEKRQEWMENYDDETKQELKELEREENEVLQDLESVQERIEDRERKIASIENGTISESYGDDLIERNSIVEELNVVRNDLVEAYIALKSATEEERAEIEEAIQRLKDKEDAIEDKLREFDSEN